MTDAAWAAVAASIASICSLIGALCAKSAGTTAQAAVAETRATSDKLDRHEAASAERGRAVQAALQPSAKPEARHDFLIP